MFVIFEDFDVTNYCIVLRDTVDYKQEVKESHREKVSKMIKEFYRIESDIAVLTTVGNKTLALSTAKKLSKVHPKDNIYIRRVQQTFNDEGILFQEIAELEKRIKPFENYIENQLERVDIQNPKGLWVKFQREHDETKWLNWEDTLNYLISKGIGE